MVRNAKRYHIPAVRCADVDSVFALCLCARGLGVYEPYVYVCQVSRMEIYTVTRKEHDCMTFAVRQAFRGYCVHTRETAIQIRSHTEHATDVNCMNETRSITTNECTTKSLACTNTTGPSQLLLLASEAPSNKYRCAREHTHTVHSRVVCTAYTVRWDSLFLTLWLFCTGFGVHQLLVLCVTVSTQFLDPFVNVQNTLDPRAQEKQEKKPTNEYRSRVPHQCANELCCHFSVFNSWIRLLAYGSLRWRFAIIENFEFSVNENCRKSQFANAAPKRNGQREKTNNEPSIQ